MDDHFAFCLEDSSECYSGTFAAGVLNTTSKSFSMPKVLGYLVHNDLQFLHSSNGTHENMQISRINSFGVETILFTMTEGTTEQFRFYVASRSNYSSSKYDFYFLKNFTDSSREHLHHYIINEDSFLSDDIVTKQNMLDIDAAGGCVDAIAFTDDLIGMICYHKMSFYYVKRDDMTPDYNYTHFKNDAAHIDLIHPKTPLFAATYSNEQTLFIYETITGWASIEILHAENAPAQLVSRPHRIGPTAPTVFSLAVYKN